MASPLRRTKLAKRLGFDLADALAGYVEFLTDFFQGVLALAADAEAQPDHFLFLGRQRFQNIGGLVANVRIDDRVNWRSNPAVFDQIAEGRFTIAADRRFERNRVARNGLELLYFLDRNVHAPADFVVGRSAAQFLLKLSRRAQELVHALVHVHRNADGARLVGDGARDGLANPPSGVGGKLVAAPVFKLVSGPHQADIALLDQVQQVQPTVDVLLCHRNDQAKVGLYQILLGAF